MKKKDVERLVASIVKKIGKEGVEYVKKHGELPSVKLTAEEMKLIKAGIDRDKIKDLFGPTIFNPFEIRKERE